MTPWMGWGEGMGDPGSGDFFRGSCPREKCGFRSWNDPVRPVSQGNCGDVLPGSAATTKNDMAKVKLELQDKNDGALRDFAINHKMAMTGNLNFPTPTPDAAIFDAALSAYSDKLDDIAEAEIELQTQRSEEDALRVTLDANLTGRGSYVDLAFTGIEAKILSAGFQVQAAASPTNSMPVPTGVVSSMGDNEGEIDVSCDAVPKTNTYVIECREHSETAAPGTWQQAKLSSRSSTSVTGLTSGKKYAFRFRALGPNDLESPWSGETVCMAP